jgi:hypothetical protein
VEDALRDADTFPSMWPLLDSTRNMINEAFPPGAQARRAGLNFLPGELADPEGRQSRHRRRHPGFTFYVTDFASPALAGYASCGLPAASGRLQPPESEERCAKWRLRNTGYY